MSSVVPDGWSVYALGELGQVVGGGTPPSETLSYWGGSVMWATPAEITKLKSRYINKTLRTITKEGLQKSSAKLHPKGTILLTSRASIGYPAINSVPMATNQGFQSLRPNEKLDVEYGYQLILNNRNGLERLSAGSTFLEISSKEINKYKLPIPPLPEQKKIASILTSVDEVIENTQKQIDKLQDLKKATMNELLTKGIGPGGGPHTEFKDSELGRIPKSWEVVSCEDVCKKIMVGIVITPSKYYTDVGVPVFRSANVTEEGINFRNLKYISEKSNELLKKSKLTVGDVLTVRTGYPGTSAVVQANGEGCNCVDVVISRPNKEVIHSNFLCYWINSDYGKGEVLKKQGGLAQQHFNVGDLRELKLVLPCLDEQRRVLNILESQSTRLEVVEQKLAQTQSLKKSLMQDLLTGKVRVTVN